MYAAQVAEDDRLEGMTACMQAGSATKHTWHEAVHV